MRENGAVEGKRERKDTHTVEESTQTSASPSAQMLSPEVRTEKIGELMRRPGCRCCSTKGGKRRERLS